MDEWLAAGGAPENSSGDGKDLKDWFRAGNAESE
jgi:hypothetical protein